MAIRSARRGLRWWARLRRFPTAKSPKARTLYLERYANSKYWVDFEDFGFYRMNVVDVYYVGGFGVMGWVPASEYDFAKPDPLADAAEGIIQHMNADHQYAMMLIAQVFGKTESEEATMTSIDRLGFQVRLKTAEGMKGVRIAFPREVASTAETRAVLIEMTERARQQAGSTLPQ